jgi:hypothetical protein
VASRTLLFTKIAAAIVQYLTAAVVLGGKSLTPQALSALYAAALQSQKDLEDARTVVAAKKQARDAAVAAVLAVQPDLQKYLAATYGEASTTYAAFGLPVAKQAVRTAETVAGAVTKARTTRAKHKAALEGTAPVPAPAPKS